MWHSALEKLLKYRRNKKRLYVEATQKHKLSYSFSCQTGGEQLLSSCQGVKAEKKTLHCELFVFPPLPPLPGLWQAALTRGWKVGRVHRSLTSALPVLRERQGDGRARAVGRRESVSEHVTESLGESTCGRVELFPVVSNDGRVELCGDCDAQWLSSTSGGCPDKSEQGGTGRTGWGERWVEWIDVE